MAGRDLDRGRLLIPDPITVLLTRPASQAGGPEESFEVDHVQEQAEDEGEVDSPMGGSFDAVTTRFHLWAVECGGLVPGRDWLITKAVGGTGYRITDVDHLAHGRRFRCHCTKRQG